MSSLYQKLDDNEIRILVVLAGKDTEPVRYQLKHITLGGTAQYQTLLYLPEESSKVEIFVNGYKLEVTKSCKLALEELGKKEIGDGTIPMTWIAEVCINHDDPIERQHHTSLIHRISKEARNHNIWQSFEPENYTGQVQKPSGIVQFKEDELTSPAEWSKYFHSSDDSGHWQKIAAFFSNTHDLGPQNGNASPLDRGAPTKPRSLGNTIASLFVQPRIVGPTDKTAPLSSSVENAHSLFANMVDRACQGSVDSRMILHTHLNLTAILGLGSDLLQASAATSTRSIDSLKAHVPNSKVSDQDAAALNCLDMSYQHFIIPPARLNTTPLTLAAAPVQNHRGFKLHLDHKLIAIELPQPKDEGGMEDKEKGGADKEAMSSDKGSDKKSSNKDPNNDPTLPESVALPEPTAEELAFLEAVDLDQIHDDSPSRLQWMRMKRENGEENIFIDRLMRMADLENVKSHFLKTKIVLETLRRQGADTATECLNTVFVGDPRVCKPVTRLYAHFLISISAVPGSEFIEITTAEQHKKGNTCAWTSGNPTQIRSSQSGVFLMTDADLIRDCLWGDDHAKNLRREMKTYQGKFVFLYTCSAKDEMDSFLKFEGVGKQIPCVVKLDNFLEKNDSIRELIEQKFRNKMQVEGGIDGEYSRIFMRRACRGKSPSIESAFSKVCRRQLDRIYQERWNGGTPDDLLITKEDMLGPGPPNPLDESQAWKEMMQMVGMDSVKESIRGFASLVRLNHQRELDDKPPLRVGLNRVFLGPPGTGKTTVARLYAKILGDLGLLSSGGSIIKNASDFIGQYVGWSEKAVKSALESAKGKVLVIDEAHMLYPGKRSGRRDPGGDVFRIAAIDTLVSEIENTPGEDRCVVLIGYTEPMREMFQYSNPGLARRFPLEDAFRFEDFSMEQLTHVLELKLDQQKLATTERAKDVALQLLAMARDRPNFGNGGEVDNLLNHAITSQQRRMSADIAFDLSTSMVLQPEDFDADFDRLSDSENRSRENFKDFVGYEDVIAEFDNYQRVAKGMRMCGKNPRSHKLIPVNFIFKGPPGTGKTTMARKVGKVFYDMGFLSTAEVVECSVSDIIGESLGETGPKVISVLERALGKVLFIDEAYRLAQGDFAKDAINELVDCLTKERFINKMVVILAGYEKGMDILKNINQGFGSRFSKEVVFHRLSPEHCLMLLQRFIAEFGIRIDGIEDDSLDGKIRSLQVIRLFKDLSETASWGNGRDVKTLANIVCHRVFMSCTTEHTRADNLAISSMELQPIMQRMLEEKRQKRK